jgi:RAP1 GTPase activating protein 1
MRPSSPLLDSVRDLFEGQDQMARDFAKAFVFPKDGSEPLPNLYDIIFLVGQGKNKTRLYGVRAILGVRSRYVIFELNHQISSTCHFLSFCRVFQELLYGITAGFGSPQIPVAEILARALPSLHNLTAVGSGGGAIGKGKSSNFLQVPVLEGPR